MTVVWKFEWWWWWWWWFLLFFITALLLMILIILIITNIFLFLAYVVSMSSRRSHPFPVPCVCHLPSPLDPKSQVVLCYNMYYRIVYFGEFITNRPHLLTKIFIFITFSRSPPRWETKGESWIREIQRLGVLAPKLDLWSGWKWSLFWMCLEGFMHTMQVFRHPTVVKMQSFAFRSLRKTDGWLICRKGVVKLVL